MLSSQRFTIKAILLLTILLTSISMFGCSGQLTKWNPDDYTVKSGDTPYSIAWRYEIDPENFAAWNHISLSNRLKAGQRLHTRKPVNFDAIQKAKKKKTEVAVVSGTVDANPVSKPVYLPAPITNKSKVQQKDSDSKWIKAKKGDSLYTISKRTNISIKRLAQLNQLKKPYVIQPGQTIYLKPLPGSSTAKKESSQAASSGPSSSGSSKSTAVSWPKSVRWVSPAKGKVIKRFSRNSNGPKGIHIAGKQGDGVYAAADGKVVYSGNGLISYGNLIIIKHNKTYLSAYAYNRKLLVKEGTQVKAGQKIAEMGRKDKQSPRLHFEIRKNGKSVDPLKYIR